MDVKGRKAGTAGTAAVALNVPAAPSLRRASQSFWSSLVSSRLVSSRLASSSLVYGLAGLLCLPACLPACLSVCVFRRRRLESGGHFRVWVLGGPAGRTTRNATLVYVLRGGFAVDFFCFVLFFVFFFIQRKGTERKKKREDKGKKKTELGFVSFFFCFFFFGVWVGTKGRGWIDRRPKHKTVMEKKPETEQRNLSSLLLLLLMMMMTE